jgi:hypothetical protein
MHLILCEVFFFFFHSFDILFVGCGVTLFKQNQHCEEAQRAYQSGFLKKDPNSTASLPPTIYSVVKPFSDRMPV